MKMCNAGIFFCIPANSSVNHILLIIQESSSSRGLFLLLFFLFLKYRNSNKKRQKKQKSINRYMVFSNLTLNEIFQLPHFNCLFVFFFKEVMQKAYLEATEKSFPHRFLSLNWKKYMPHFFLYKSVLFVYLFFHREY